MTDSQDHDLVVPWMDTHLSPGRRLATWMAANRISGVDLADRIGVTAEHLSRLCNDRVPGSPLLRRIIMLEAGVDFWSSDGREEGCRETI